MNLLVTRITTANDPNWYPATVVMSEVMAIAARLDGKSSLAWLRGAPEPVIVDTAYTVLAERLRQVRGG